MAAHFQIIWFLLSFLLFLQTEQTVFLSANDANKVITRPKRAHFFFFEEFLQGDLERECLEERCSLEEAREVFEDDEKLKIFWNGYFGGRQCSSNPCLHNGACMDNIRSYICSCTSGYEGDNCALDKCACGRFKYTVKTTKMAEMENSLARGFPWQVLLLNSEGKSFCGGVLLASNFVLTTATCALLHRNFVIKVGAGKDGVRQVMNVNEKHIHIRYDKETGENNIALIQLQEHIECNSYQLPICTPDRDFAEHVLIPQLAGTVSGWKIEGTELTGVLKELQVSHLPIEECEQLLNTSLTNREFCGHHQAPMDEPLAGGNFAATDYKGTWFLTGITGTRPTKATNPEIFLFTKIARYMMWFKQTMV
ncbi:PREDICTED: vitamin K-dependent protein Z isoform X2 [Crocodylus porosus]|uniref:vitamin K-dependent protein Z isoform X2 n=1 Tax=Crocodylus porosus TaxID=8502 RepID=UPI00094017E8|nr:PREDICTED: vitamin K-dependent protein Z isoform X2 [Crocodylus porosus]